MSERCAELSEAAGESLVATAVTARVWLLLEVPGSWPRDVGDEGVLPEEAQRAVATWLAETPGSRLQFLRRPRRRHASNTGAPVAFVLRAEEGQQDVRRIELGRYEELASLDLGSAGQVVERSFVLVCGHGSRDRCCALRGAGVFAALADRLDEEQLWMSSHQGGHRFAANVLVLPLGLQFGRVEAGEAPYLVARALGGRIELERYRGRTCYEPAVQAAEHAVRTAASLDGAEDLRLIAREDDRVRFRAWDGAEWTALVAQVDGPSVAPSCEAAPAPQRAFRTRVLEPTT